MIGTIVGVLTGFAGGILYSRGRADPVQAAWFDVKRGSRTAGRCIVWALRDIAQRVRWRCEL